LTLKLAEGRIRNRQALQVEGLAVSQVLICISPHLGQEKFPRTTTSADIRRRERLSKRRPWRQRPEL